MTFIPPSPDGHLSSNWVRGDEAVRSQGQREAHGRSHAMCGRTLCVVNRWAQF